MIINYEELYLATHISNYQILWIQANSAAKDILIFIWILKYLIVPKEVVEINTTNPTFYLTRFCIGALTHTNRHYEDFCTNIDNMNALPQIEPYDSELTREIQEMTNNQFPEFPSALDILTGEDTTLLHDATHNIKIWKESFQIHFHQHFTRFNYMTMYQEH